MELSKEKEQLNTTLKQERSKISKMKEEEAFSAISTSSSPSPRASQSIQTPVLNKGDFLDIYNYFIELYETLQTVTTYPACTETTLRIRDAMLQIKNFKERLNISQDELIQFLTVNPQTTFSIPPFNSLATKDSFDSEESYEKFNKLQTTAKRVVHQLIDELHFLVHKLPKMNNVVAYKEFLKLKNVIFSFFF